MMSNPMRMSEEVVGARGFEPPASWSRTRRASQAALRPDDTHSGAPEKRPEWNPQNSIAHGLSLERGGLAAFGAGAARLNAGAVI